MKKRTLCLLLAGTMVLSLLSGCGGRKTADDNAGDAQNSSAAGIESGGGDAAKDTQNGEEIPAPAENQDPLSRDPRWDKLQPGETAVQYYDIFIKSGMTVGEAVEAVESSAIYQEQSISWVTSLAELDEEFTVQAPEEIGVVTSDKYKIVAEEAQAAHVARLVIQRDGNTIMTVHYFYYLPGEEGTTYRLRDVPIFLVTADHISNKYSNFDETRTFIGSIGEIRAMGRQDLDGLFDTAFPARDPNVDLKVTEGHYWVYDVVSYLPFSWNGYSIRSCQDDGIPREGFPVYSSFMLNPDKDEMDDNWILDGRMPTTEEYWWVADNAG